MKGGKEREERLVVNEGGKKGEGYMGKSEGRGGKKVERPVVSFSLCVGFDLMLSLT